MEKKILKAIEEAYRKGLKDAEGLNDISPYLLTSQVVAQELANKFCQPLVVEQNEQFYCVSSNALVYGKPCEKWCGDENCKALCKQ